jgi:hypothetical protein
MHVGRSGIAAGRLRRKAKHTGHIGQEERDCADAPVERRHSRAAAWRGFEGRNPAFETADAAPQNVQLLGATFRIVAG